MARLAAKDLVKKIKQRNVVDGISLRVESGETVGLLGPNGAGKTTSFDIIVGLIGCERGQVLLDSHDITRLPMHLRARLGLGYLPQEPSVFRKLSVLDNVLAILETRADLQRAQRLQVAEELLEELNVAHLRNQMGISLSGGERRRVEFARALATEPRFLLLDEPFAGVDPLTIKDIQDVIKQLCERGIGILITDHREREVLASCSRIHVIADGKIIAQGSPDQIINDPQAQELYLGDTFKL